MRRLFSLALLLAALSLHADAQAQTAPADTSGAEVIVVLEDGTRVAGTAEVLGADEVTIRTADGLTITIPRARIVRIELRGDRKFVGQDPNETRLLIGPTARSLRSGEGYAALYQIFVPFVGIGIEDVVTMAGGVTINPGSGRLAYLAPKVTFWNRNDLAIAAGGIAVIAVGDGGTSDPVGLGFVVGTIGSSEQSVTIGLAQGYADGTASNVFGLIGAELQVGNRAKLITENYVFVLGEGEAEIVFSGGIRFFGDRLSADFALISASSIIGEGVGFPFLPWIGFATTF
jgi:hypothetical protein